MIQMTRSGTLVDSEEALLILKDRFIRERYLKLPKLIESGLLGYIVSEVEQGAFAQRVHNKVGVEVCLEDVKILTLLTFLTNSKALFTAIEKITGCEQIGCFTGRVYRMIPGEGHYDNWHTDMRENRLAALSINFSTEVYSGGVLQLRDTRSNEIIQQIENINLGDAILFQIAPFLEHRITDVKGAAPKTAFAGWFRSKPDFHAELRKNREPKAE